jgi:hypothetical protein
MVHEHGSRGIMSSYTLAGILAQEIPDHLMLDIALHFQANDNRCANQQTSQLNNFLDRPPHQSDKIVAQPDRSNDGPHRLPRGSKAWDISERLEALWDWYRAAAPCSRRLSPWITELALKI